MRSLKIEQKWKGRGNLRYNFLNRYTTKNNDTFNDGLDFYKWPESNLF